MQTVFSAAVTSIEVDDAHSIIAATGQSRVVLFRLAIGKLGKSYWSFLFWLQA
jgi:hypothetical protein